ncbi:MAG: thioredoxin family protein [Holophagae bacterium]|jgi:thioredoxin 1
MALVDITDDNFEELVLGGDVVLLDCWARWCKGCKDFDPVFEAAATRHPDHTFGRVDTGSEKELTQKLKVQHIPTLIVFREGILLMRQPGQPPAEALDEIVDKAAALDMEYVRSELEKESARNA